MSNDIPSIRYGNIVMPVYQGEADTGRHHLVLSWSVAGTLPDGRKFRITVARGFSFDGCSIPRLLWRLCGHPMEVPRVAAALAHDWLYAAHVCDRETADMVYRSICAAVGMGAIRVATEYRALRWFGGSAWDSHGATDQLAARAHGSLILDGVRQLPATNTNTKKE